MNIILLSGGSGKRLWPLSNEIRSKQFIKIFKNEQGEYESMVQRVYHQIISVNPEANITIATSRSQVSAIRNQLGDNVSICVEPSRRDTFPAILLAATYLHCKKGVGEDESVIVCPVDPYVSIDYFRALSQLEQLTQNGEANLTLMGVEPTYPSEKYGYIIPSNTEQVSFVEAFKEKPQEQQVKEYLEQGALWNCGVFGFQLGYLLEIGKQYIDSINYEDVYNQYDRIKKISFDYAVVEKESKIQVLRFSGSWKDIGTWNTFVEEMSEPVIGNAIVTNSCEDTNVINELNIPIVCTGCKNMVVAASGDGILIAEKHQSSFIKPVVEKIGQMAMFAEKSWGSFQILDIQPGSLTIKITLQPKHHLYYHSHEHRDEVWTVMSGTGYSIVDGVEERVYPGKVITMPSGSKHTIYADTELKVIEVQLGEDININDKIKYQLRE